MILFKSFDPNNFRNIDKHLYEKGDLEMEEFQEEFPDKLPFVGILIEVKSLITFFVRHLTRIFVNQYQNPLVNVIKPPPK